jgi:nucleoside triphosphate pyrophosphatase
VPERAPGATPHAVPGATPDAPRSPVLVLGSASPARATLLRAAGVEPVIWHSRVDEDAMIAAAGSLAADPARLTQVLATAKARDVADQVRAGEVPGAHADAARVLVVGADSMLDFDGQVLGKARTAQEVRDRWAAMSGQSGVLVTGHTVIDLASGRLVERAVATTIRFGRPDRVELEAYIASGEPLAVAGSCTIDGLGGPFIDGIDGDHTNVIGLALPTLRALLGELGVRWTDLWSRA